MANLVNCTGVHVAVPDRVLLREVSLGVDDGDRVGVVGRNGGGKSTLLRVLAGRLDPDDGRVSVRSGSRVGMLDQRDQPTGRTVAETVLGDRAAHEWAGDARVRDVVGGLLGDLDAAGVGGMDAATDALSGGQLRRVALARVLVDDPDVLLLDEPTNHLDVDGVAWLAEHLRARAASGRGALVVVTHDRWFLDAVVTTTWEVHDGEVDAYEGGYAAWVLARAERQRVAAVTEERRQNLVRKELAWLRRGAPARTSKPRFRLDAAADLIADEPPPRDGVALQRLAAARLGKDVLDLEDVRVDHPRGGEPLLAGTTWRLAPGERYGVVGANGAGKTTMLRLLTGQREPDGGRVRRGKTVEVACLTQDLAELAPVAHRRAVEAVADVAQTAVVGGREMTASQLVEQLGFPRERQWTRVSELSGGERRRLQLLRLLLQRPNVLLLDEPTNDLDTDSLAAMEDVLDSFAGTLVVVSHDRYLLERLCDRYVGMLGDGALRDLPRGVEEYLERRSAGGTAGGSAPSSAGPAPTAAGDRPGPGLAAADLRAARKDLARLERRLERLGAEETRLHEDLAARATDAAAVLELDARLRDVTAERDQVEAEWLALAEVVEGS
ncbi:ABC-F family ATP-binding cassette domain-containing protein [Aquipuribacter sp. SD81]|uniref:ABC-F family ATP-binding cassette domain-containing protein n=1 Tax=Aquipuribacter sp. SD81 TaxID=3127703 RepID=UPI00301B58A0